LNSIGTNSIEIENYYLKTNTLNPQIKVKVFQ